MKFLPRLLNWFRSADNMLDTFGLTTEIRDLALDLVRIAAASRLDNTRARTLAVELLTRRNIPESVARLAVEVAVRTLKNGAK